MRRLVAWTTVLALSLTSAPLFAAGAARRARVAARQGGPQTGTVKATAKSPQGQTLMNYTVRIRNLATGNIAGSATSDVAGDATFTGLAQGNYAIEIVNAAGEIVGTSAAITVTAGAAGSVTVTASAAAVLTGGVAGGIAGGAGASTAGISTALIVTAMAGAAGVVGVVVAKNTATASASR